MKRALIICLSVAFVALLPAVYFRSPTRQASIGQVTVSFRGFEADQHDKSIFVISNGGPYALNCAVGTEVKQSGKWQDPPEGRSFDSALIPLLPPRTATTFALDPPSSTGLWRAVVYSERYYEGTEAGRRKRDFDWYVRKKAFVDTSRSEGISMIP